MDINHMFRLTYEKSSEEIKTKLSLKIQALQVKISERGKRISALRKEYDIDDAALIEILEEAVKREKEGRFQGSITYSNKRRPTTSGTLGTTADQATIGAGVVSHLMEERKLIDEERQQVERLGLIYRNLRPVHHSRTNGVPYTEDCFVLTYDELEFLGF